VTLLAPMGAGLALLVLGRTQFAPCRVAAMLAFLPLIVLAAPDRTELGATMLIEAPVVYVLGVALRIDALRLLIASGFVNAVTQPLLYMALRHFASADHWFADFLFLEGVVWAAEALLYLACTPGLRRARQGICKALAVSLAANMASALIGLAVSA
jgi:hypothetical protein